MTREEAIQALAEQLDTLNNSFARSLVSQYNHRRSLSEKQWPWVFKLIEPKDHVVDEVRAAEIIELFDKASERRKYPKVIITNNHIELRFTRAGDKARFPGSINIIINDHRVWIGRIHIDGKVQVRASVDQRTLDDALRLVREFSNDPMGVATRSGQINGECCFCSKKLTHDVSKHVGYGPTCAKTYGLEWNTNATVDIETSNQVEFVEVDQGFQIVNIDSAVGEIDGELTWVNKSNAAVLTFDSKDDAKADAELALAQYILSNA